MLAAIQDFSCLRLGYCLSAFSRASRACAFPPRVLCARASLSHSFGFPPFLYSRSAIESTIALIRALRSAGVRAAKACCASLLRAILSELFCVVVVLSLLLEPPAILRACRGLSGNHACPMFMYVVSEKAGKNMHNAMKSHPFLGGKLKYTMVSNTKLAHSMKSRTEPIVVYYRIFCTFL